MNSTNNNIYAIYLGGKHPSSNIELHDLVVTTGESIQDCFEFCRQNWFVNNPIGQSTNDRENLFGNLNPPKPAIIPHIDGYYKVELPQDYVSGGEYSLYCMNYGGYLPGQLAEMHEFVMVFARDKGDAIKRSKKLLKLKFGLLHMDNCLSLDDMIDVSELSGCRFHSPNPEGVTVTLHQEYYSI
jgi:hypothetical protein